MDASLFDAICFEFDREDVKAQRSVARSRTCQRKRAEYERTREARSVPASRRGASQPQGAVRAAARTFIAQGAVEADVDMPTVINGSRGAKAPWWRMRKPSISPLLKPHAPSRNSPLLKPHAPPRTSPLLKPNVPPQSSCNDLAEHETCDELELAGGMLPEAAAVFSDDAESNAAGSDIDSSAHQLASVEESASEKESQTGEAEDGVDSDSESEVSPKTVKPQIPVETVSQEGIQNELKRQQIQIEAEAAAEEKERKAAKREEILRQLVAKLHMQASEAKRAAAEAKAEAQAALEAKREAEDAARRQAQAEERSKEVARAKQTADAKRQAKILAQKFRKERIAEAARAQTAQEAKSAKEQALAEAQAMKEAAENAKAATEQAMAEAQMMKDTAASEARALQEQAKREQNEARATAEAEAAAVKHATEREVQALKAQMERELEAARQEVRAIREAALVHDWEVLQSTELGKDDDDWAVVA